MTMAEQLRGRLNQVEVDKGSIIRTVEKASDDATYDFEEIQGMVDCDSDMFTLRDKLKEELSSLLPMVEQSRELKARLQDDKRIKSKLLSDLKQEFEDMETEIEELETKLRNEDNNTPMILRLMKSHKPGPDTNRNGKSNHH